MPLWDSVVIKDIPSCLFNLGRFVSFLGLCPWTFHIFTTQVMPPASRNM